MIPSQLHHELDRAETILCISHVSPDGDALGSLLGMGHLLTALGKRPTLALHDKAPADFSYMPGFETIIGPEQVADTYDLIVVLDASSRDRMGDVYRSDAHDAIPMLVIDHHVTNTYFGQVNWVDPSCAAASQMLVLLADALAVPLSQDLAICLLTGLVTDTLCFRTPNTDARVLEAAMRLVDAGASLADIAARTVNSLPFKVFNLWGQVFPHIGFEDGVIWAPVSLANMQVAGVGPGEDGSLSSKLIIANEADISATFVEKINRKGEAVVECSFRAKPGFDVAQLALSYGGGGHPPAAGCTIEGELYAVTERVVADLRALRNRLVAAKNGQAKA